MGAEKTERGQFRATKKTEFAQVWAAENTNFGQFWVTEKPGYCGSMTLEYVQCLFPIFQFFQPHSVFPP